VAPLRRFLTPRDLALALGASESSLKRWIDDGAVSASRTAGGHRRILLAEAVRFIRESRMPILRPELLGLEVPPTSSRGEPPATEDLVDAMRAGEGSAVGMLVTSAFLGGVSTAEICDGPLRGALAVIGELWRQGPDGIALEHQAVDACAQALGTIRHALPEPEQSAPVALGGAVAGDPYLLPSLAASVVLREVGYHAINLGPDLPGVALAHGIERHRPSLVWRSASIAIDGRDLRRDVEALEQGIRTRRTELVLGGRGLASTSVPRGERCHAFSSMAELAGFARGLLASRAAGRP
jgi:MerR family transcriptional regulator, light-induced transcriptional regulator